MRLLNRPLRLKGLFVGGLLILIALGALPNRAGAVESWLFVPDLPEGRSQMQAVGHEGLLYVFGGVGQNGQPLDTFRVYDSATGSWSAGLPMPSARHSYCLAKSGATAYLIGGADSQGYTTAVDAYNLELGFWIQGVAPLPEIVEDAAAAAVLDVVYVIGGLSGSGYSSQTWALDPFLNVWNPLAPLSFPRVHHTAVAHGGLIYVFGGHDHDTGQTVLEVEVYDPATNTWSVLARPMSSHRSYHGAALVNGRIFAVGGNLISYDENVCLGGPGPLQGQPCDGNWQCDWATNCGAVYKVCIGGSSHELPCEDFGDCPDGDCVWADFSCHGGLNHGDSCGDSWHTCPDGACRIWNGMCEGGWDHGSSCDEAGDCSSGVCLLVEWRSSVVELDPATGLWHTRLDLNEPREHLAVAAVGGLLYAVGGISEEIWPSTRRTVEVYTGYCGDGFVSPSEDCDDGNTAADDGCNTEDFWAVCEVESGWQCVGSPSACDGICGDGLLRGTELCDDGNPNNCDGCDLDCQVETGGCCGDGVIDDGEGCDDGGFVPGDGCTERCATEPGWACAGEPSLCSMVCGDGTVLAGEACDDGGLADGDGCASDCTVEDFWTCEGEPSLCSTECGDGTVLGAEECDDGSIIDGDGCASDCTLEPGWTCDGEPSLCYPSCGDGVVDPSEECDDGNLLPGDGCTGSCVVEDGWTCGGEPTVCTENSLCGNGFADGAEECDDGNGDDGDGCTGSCVVEDGWTCDGEPSVCGEKVPEDDDGCGCASGGAGGCLPVGLLWMIVLGWITRRRRLATTTTSRR